MEEKVEKKLIEYQLETLLDLLKESIENKNIFQFKWFIETVSSDYKNEKGLYKKCIEDLTSIKYYSDEDYIKEASLICEYYLNRANGTIYDQTFYIKKYRKEHYKQLNVDVPKILMKQFEECLKYCNLTKKEFIINSINDFVNDIKE